MVALPAPTALTTPDASTVATAGVSLVHTSSASAASAGMTIGVSFALRTRAVSSRRLGGKLMPLTATALWATSPSPPAQAARHITQHAISGLERIQSLSHDAHVVRRVAIEVVDLAVLPGEAEADRRRRIPHHVQIAVLRAIRDVREQLDL